MTQYTSFSTIVSIVCQQKVRKHRDKEEFNEKKLNRGKDIHQVLTK